MGRLVVKRSRHFSSATRSRCNPVHMVACQARATLAVVAFAMHQPILVSVKSEASHEDMMVDSGQHELSYSRMLDWCVDGLIVILTISVAPADTSPAIRSFWPRYFLSHRLAHRPVTRVTLLT